MKLLRRRPEIALKALRAMAYDLRIWRVGLGSPHSVSGHARLAFQNQTIAVALIIVGFAFIPSSSTNALPAIPPIGGPGYQDGNIAQAFQIGNRRGRDPFLRRQNRQFQKRLPQNADSNGGNTNYLLTVPVVTIPGRGLNVALTLYYNSQMWTEQPSTESTGVRGGSQAAIGMVFDHDADWPAPGWLLSFGRMIQAGVGAVLQDPDGTLHPFLLDQSSAVNGSYVFNAHTTDGSLINYTGQWNSDNTSVGTAKFPNGTTVTYGAGGNYAMYATRITDANGNFISISYVGNLGPQIDHVEDSLGRLLAFKYDLNNRLVAITAPGLDGEPYPVVRLHYTPHTLLYPFSARLGVEPVQVLKKPSEPAPSCEWRTRRTEAVG